MKLADERLIPIAGAAIAAILIWKVVGWLITFKSWCSLYGKIGGPPTHPFWGTLHLYNDASGYIKMVLAHTHATHCKTMAIWCSLYPRLTVTHPDNAKVLLKTFEPKDKGLIGPYRFLLPWLGDGLLVSSGKKWARNRHLLTPAFHFEILRPYILVYNTVADTFLSNLAKDCNGEQGVEISSRVSMATLDTMLQCALSYKGNVQQEGENHPYVSAVQSLADLFIQRYLNPLLYFDSFWHLSSLGKEYQRQCNFVHRFSNEIIAARKEALDRDPNLLQNRRLDFLDILLSAKDEAGNGLTVQEIRDEVDTFMFEGHDTTASLISWAIYDLGKYPDEQDKIYKEISSIARDKRNISWEDIGKFEYLQCFLNEVMRMHSPVPVISRTLTDACVFDGVDFPAGTSIDLSIHAMNHHPDVWPDHMMFRPERFGKDVSVDRDPYKFTPFSAGPRNCIGQNFAMNEAKVLIARTVSRFKITHDSDHTIEEYPTLVMRSKTGIYVKMEERLE